MASRSTSPASEPIAHAPSARRPPSTSASAAASVLARLDWRALFDQRSLDNRALTIALAGLFVLGNVAALPGFRNWLPGVDLDIPLNATARWAAGGQPYLASSFQSRWGPDLPFLYPPWLLPLLAPLLALPRAAVVSAWLLVGIVAAVWTCRRLSIPWIALPLALSWPPFVEGLITGNVQIVQFAAFAALFYVPGAAWSLRTRPLREEADPRNGLLAAGVGAFKYTQLVPLVYLLRRRPRAAIVGLAALAAVAAALLAFTGLPIYRDWLAQLQRADNAHWQLIGSPLSMFVGRPLALLAAVAAVAGALLVRGRDAGAWIGLGLLVAAPSVHGYGMLFLVPALLTIRRDLALALALAVASYDSVAWWAAIVVAALALAASARVPALRSVDLAGDHAADPDPVRFAAEAAA